MAEIKKITVIGATGNLGAPVVKFLLSYGYEVKIVVRNLQKAKNIFGDHPHLTMEEADLADVSSLKKALSDTAYLYLNLATQTTDIQAPFCPDREGVANILEAVDKTKIKQILVISGLGAFSESHLKGATTFVPNAIRMQGHQMIKASGIPYTLLHCSWFSDSFVFYRRKGTYSVIGDAKNPIYFTNCYDFTGHLVKAIGNPDAFNREFPIQGTEGIPHPVAAKTFLNEFDQESKVSVLSHGLLKILAFFNKDMKYVKHMSDYFSAYSEPFLAEKYDTYKILGKPTLSLTAYAQKLKKEGIYNYLNESS
jgi:hypothetical protein